MDEKIETLSYAVRGWVVARYLGQLAIVLALLTAVPLIVAVLEGEYTVAWRCLGVIALLGTAGLLARTPPPKRIQTNEALSVVALAFVLAPLLMSFPMMGHGISFVDALFESVSGITTTGLSILGSVHEEPKSALFLRAWLQWYGGLGIVVFSVALMAGHHMASRQLVQPESESGEGLATTTRVHARRMLSVYLTLTVVAFVLLTLFGVDAFDALSHTLAAVSTGGFSTFDRSLGGFTGFSPYLLMLISLGGAVAFPLYYRTFRNGPRELLADVELRGLLAMVIVSCLLLALLLHVSNGMGWGDAFRHGFLMGVSAQSTTGFSSLDVTQLSAATKLMLILSMAAGGTVGSTAGGLKILRLLIFLRLLQLVIRRTAMPTHAVAEPHLGGRRLEEAEIIRALLLMVLFVAVVLLSWLPFVLSGYAPLDALFEVVSAIGTVGLSTGITGAGLAPGLKLLLCLDMWFGRLEIVAFLVVLYPWTWIGKRTESL